MVWNASALPVIIVFGKRYPESSNVTLPYLTVPHSSTPSLIVLYRPSRLKTLFSRVQGVRKDVRKDVRKGLKQFCPPTKIKKFYKLYRIKNSTCKTLDFYCRLRATKQALKNDENFGQK
jgi:hypothetical protein